MTANADPSGALLTFLRQHEASFNEELHLLLTGRKRVECHPADGPERGHGWVVTWADATAGEWHLAHPFGTPDAYLPDLPLLPRDPALQLLVPVSAAAAACSAHGLSIAENLIWFRDTGRDASPETACRHAPPLPDLELVQRWETADGAPATSGPGNYMALYFRESASIVALVKCIHLTPGTAEVYIETAPHRRGRGLGTAILREMLRRLRGQGLTMIYVVSGENTASLALARKAGLAPFQTLSRIPLVPARAGSDGVRRSRHEIIDGQSPDGLE
ncbi:MAG TPA: GNAT family N-acetyltransferase [Candidatus Ozemobacteraceae bacterium]|nr:GNAT family N-acetyltransferase [Candidatus Ozemobacteraceae bacterium]